MSRRAAPVNLIRLTKAGVTALSLAPGQSERVVWDSEVPGFGVRLRGSRRTWVIRPPRGGGRSSLHTLSPLDTLDLAEARKAARERLARAALGDDPGAARREKRAKAAMTLASAFALYREGAEGRLRSSTLANLGTHLDRHWRPLHGHALTGITRADIAARLHEVAAEHGPHAAVRARRVLSTVYAWAIAEGLAEKNPVIGTRPPAEEVRRDRVLGLAEVAAVWKACGSDDFGRIVQILLLTGQRRDEVAGMRWDELDLRDGLWRLPPERTKNARPHEVPLSTAAVAVLEEAVVWEGRPFVFGQGAGGFSGFSRAKAMLDKRVADVEAAAQVDARQRVKPWRLHDLRRTAATGMVDLGVLPHVVEALLNHVSGHRAGVAGVYNRASYAGEKRAALDLWAQHVMKLQGSA